MKQLYLDEDWTFPENTGFETMGSPAEAEQISSDEEIEAAATVVQGANDERTEVAAATLFDLSSNVLADSAPTADASTGYGSDTTTVAVDPTTTTKKLKSGTAAKATPRAKKPKVILPIEADNSDSEFRFRRPSCRLQ